MLLIFLASSAVPMITATSSADGDSAESKGEWVRISPQRMVSVDLKPASGLLHTTLGSFDPLTDPIPSFSYLDSEFSNEVFLVQLHTADAMAFASLADAYSLNILDHLPDNGWLVRTDDKHSINELRQHSEVRWISAYPSDWKLGESIQNSLMMGLNETNLSLVLAPDVPQSSEKQMSFEFANLELDRTWCDGGQCELWGVSIDDGFIASLAEDDRVLHISKLYSSQPLNSYAAQGIGLDELANITAGLNGSGEVIGVADTGIDSSHPDFGQQILTTRTTYGLDSSSLDTNSGHGTHVVGTIIGDGSGDSETRGLAPEASLHFQALEHDNTGYFGRQGSLYDLLRSFYVSGVRTGSNSWGAPGAQGEYTSDARSVDSFADHYEDFTVLFSAGVSSSGVASPSTAKNALSIGASTSPRPGSLAADAVWSSSASGFSADGRIKPDLVAPGVEICSTMSEDALSPMGQACASGTHADGGALYHQSNGSSHSTAVAAASVLLTREFLRTEAQVSAPSSDLVRATLINGAQDLGIADVPNPDEGWGQIDLVSSLHPTDGSVALDSFYDMNISLRPGFAFVYGFDVDVSHGISITVVWTDREGSSSAAQTAPRLVNDLDLILTAPDGTTWLGNDFANGLSATGGTADSINVVERIELPTGTTHQSGSWSIQVAHRGGLEQSFALVVTALGQHDPATDLAVFADSITPSSEEPLVNELLSISTAWINQAPLAASSYKVKVEDVTTGDVLREVTRASTPGGKIETLSFYWTFSTTGPHLLRLTLDSNDDVVEINDENNGINNNVKEITINVTALGLRLIPLLQDGSEPSTANQTIAASNKTLDARNETSMKFDMILRHEGTGTETVTISTGSVRMFSPDTPNSIISSPDEWTRELNISSPQVLSPAGQEGDEIPFSLTLDDISADTDLDVPRYAYAGTYVVDIEARYQLQPLIRHKMRLVVVVSEVEDVNIAVAGTNGLEAIPGEVADFAVSVRNMGNAPATYKLDCVSENRWSIELGDGVSSSQQFEPLGILEYLPMQVRIRVPQADAGQPAAESLEEVDCWLTSIEDTSLNYSIEVSMTVSKLETYHVQMYGPEGEMVAAAALSPDISVDAGMQYNHSLYIENTGNTELDLIVYLQTSSTTWPVLLSHDDDSSSSQLDVTIPAGANTTVELAAGVPENAGEGDSNSLVVSTYIDGTNRILGLKNSSTMVVRKEVGFEFDCQPNYDGGQDGNSELVYMEATIGTSSSLNCSIKNTGNAFLYLTWSVSAVDGWEMGFASFPPSLNQYAEGSFFFLAMAPEGGSTDSFQVTLRVVASHSNQTADSSLVVIMSAADSASAELTLLEEENFNLLGSSVGVDQEVRLSVRNIGNIQGEWIPQASVQDELGNVSDNWQVECDHKDGLIIAAGFEEEFVCKIHPLSDDIREVLSLRVTMLPTDGEGFISSDDGISIQVSVKRTIESSGLFAGMSTQTIGIILGAIFLVLLVIGIRLRKVNRGLDEGEMLVAEGSFSAPDAGSRREQALDIGNKANDLTSGTVDSAEIAAAIAQSATILPPLGAPPKPPSGALPKGSPPSLPQGLPPPLPKPVPTLPTESPPQAPSPIPAASPPAAAPPAEAFATAPPPLPPSGLPAGWTMEQWKHYGAEWLKRQG